MTDRNGRKDWRKEASDLWVAKLVGEPPAEPSENERMLCLAAFRSTVALHGPPGQKASRLHVMLSALLAHETGVSRVDFLSWCDKEYTMAGQKKDTDER